MSIIYNSFEANLETAFVQVMTKYLRDNYKDFNRLAIVNTAGDVDQYQPIEDNGPIDPNQLLITNLPRVICSAESANEAIYQTGIYEVTMNFIIKVDLDSGGYPQAKALQSCVIDALQLKQLKQLLTSTVDTFNKQLVVINGIVIGEQHLNEVDNRMWKKTITMLVYGFSTDAP